jgi:lysophospholipase L1-like esterase
MQENKNNQPVLLLGLTILVLILSSFIPPLDFGIVKTKQIDFLIDVKPDSLTGFNFYPQEQLNVDSKIIYSSFFQFDLSDVLSFHSGLPVLSAESVSGDLSQLKYFFDALKNTKNKNIRVAHYGDSIIEGDMITSDLRINLQNKYGGYGTGFLSITNKDVRFRFSTKQTFSDDWKTISIIESPSSELQPGISGMVSLPKAGSWVKYESAGINRSAKYFNKVRVFYRNAKKSSLVYSFDDVKEQKAVLETGSGIKELILQSEENVSSFMLKAETDNQAEFYGVSLETTTGVYVDNFPLRGNSGVSLELINPDILSGFNDLLNYKLIILNFGLNMVSEISDYRRYEREMVKVIAQMKKAFPETGFLIVSVGDKSMKKGSRFVTDPNVPKLVEAQKRIAEASGCAFWNLYQAMGGENSMHKWVSANPPLASKDYTHVNLDGARKIADMLSEAIIEASGKNIK